MDRQPRRRRASIMVKTAIAVAAVAGVAVTLYAVVPSGAGAGAVRSSDLAKAEVLTFDINTTATGDIQAKNQIEIRSELDVDSAITELAPEGTFVKAGDLVVKLNDQQITTEINDVTLTVESSRADLVGAENAYKIQQSENDSKLRQAKLKVELATLALDQWRKGEVVQKVQDIKLALENSEKELDRLSRKYAQSIELNAQGFLSKNELDLDEIALRKAKADLAKAKLDETTYHEYQYPKDEKSKVSDVEEAEAELVRVTAQNEIELTSKGADKLNKQRQLSTREERLRKLQAQLAACTMRAPSDGLVVYASSAGRNWDDTPFQVGRQVRPRETLVVLPDTSEMVAVVKVHESLAGRIRPGQRASVKVDMLGGQVFPGTVDSVGLMAETNDRWRDPNRREYTVRISLGKNATGMRPSMRCDATITMAHVEEALTVPLQAVFAADQVRFVYVPKDGKYRRVPVKVGQRSDTYAQITAGLEAGDRVLLREPGAGEILSEPWDAAALKLVGFELSDEGRPVAIQSGGGKGGPAGFTAGGRRAGSGQPGKGGPEHGGDRPGPVESAQKPEAQPAETPAAAPGAATEK
ncbi:MAG: efflux RND transporter periplasmic adaptor subunit [Phycisphaerales bacterium]|nr:efflux RND transporter periplasmic adaptor subunit [Phycisphaerales bacterium]